MGVQRSMKSVFQRMVKVIDGCGWDEEERKIVWTAPFCL